MNKLLVKPLALTLFARDILLDYLSPPRCVACGNGNLWLCRNCNLSLGPAPELVCPGCLELEPYGSVCPNCLPLAVPLNQLVSGFAYESRTFHRALAVYKEQGNRHLSGVLAHRLAFQLKRFLSAQTRPIVVPIPCSRLRRRSRGFDQAELLARIIAARLNLECRPQVLQRSAKRGHAQKGLGILERRRALIGAFAVTSDTHLLAPCRDRGVLLVDDVATSLATLETCAELLRAVGMRDVRAAVLAHAALT
ncbi:MAG: phosphoribosyltransferase family protein [Parcubacteria group bacterium]